MPTIPDHDAAHEWTASSAWSGQPNGESGRVATCHRKSRGLILIPSVGCPGMIPEPSETATAVVTNPDYSKLFVELGVGSVIVGIILVALTPFLRKLITDAEPVPAS